MNWRIVTIVVVTAIPIIIVAIILYKDYVDAISVDDNDYSCNEDEACVRYCCGHELSCDGKSHDLKDFNISKSLKHPYRILQNLTCEHDIFSGNLKDITFLKNGHIEENGSRISWKDYCIDIKDSEIIFNICFAPNQIEAIRKTYLYFMLASLPFLIITLAVYGFIKDLRNLHGKCLMAYVSSLIIMYVTLIVNSLIEEEEVLLDCKITCILIGYTLLTSVLCCFFWLNVMCYDIYKAFSVEIRTEYNGQFLKFCAYAFGIPVFYMTIIFILNFFQLIPSEFNNNIGNGSCSVNPTFDNKSNTDIIHWIYIYGPILVLLTINIVFYGVTAWKFYCVQKERTRMCRTSTSRIHSGQDNSENRTRFLSYVRLSVIMGLPWIIEILSFSLGNTWLFVASIFNCMQGFVIFMTFVWSPRTIKQLKRIYTGLLARNSQQFRSIMDFTEKNGTQGSAITLLENPCHELSIKAPECDNNKEDGEAIQDLKIIKIDK